MAYAIVGWVLIEVSATVLPIFEAPDWIVQVFTFFVILGFPLALILSWAYEITPEGIKLERDVAAGESITHVTGRKLDFAIIGALVLALGFVVYNYVLEDTDGRLPNSVAVLPFENMSVDPEEAFYASGIHEEILSQLVKLSALNVIARTSVLQYEDTDKSVPEIARELNVETVMEGSVRYAAGQIRITAQLNDGITGAHIWSETYTRDFDDIFGIESDVAMNVANALEAEFSLAEQESIEKIPTDSAEAYSLYLRSLATLEVPDIQYLDQATAVDPDFALAYAMKAYSAAYESDSLDGPENLVTAHENADRALRLDPTLGLAHAALAFVHMGNRRWAEAEQVFEQSLELSPNVPGVLVLYGRFNRYRGEYAESIRLFTRAVELDPNNPILQFHLGVTYRFAKNYDAAASALRIALDLNPAYPNAHAQLAYVEISRENLEEGLRELQIAEQLYGDGAPNWRLGQFANIYSRLGRREDVMRLFGELEERERQSPVRAANWAVAYIALGDYEEAYQRLEAAVNDPTPASNDTIPLGNIKANIYADPVLEEPRFQELRDRIGAF